MKNHTFIFQPGHWLGEGKIKLSMMDESLSFYTRWKIPESDKGGNLECVQEIQVAGLSDLMLNEFVFSDISSGNFNIELENQSLGRVIGSGIKSEEVIAWEFRMPEHGFEGFEFYERTQEDEYVMHAEYATNDDFRTVIHGRVWKQVSQ